MADAPYSPPSFYFQLQFDGAALGLDNAFQEAAGLAIEGAIEASEPTRLPAEAKYSNLVLRRGFVRSSSVLATWCAATLAADFTVPIQPRNVQLLLLNGAGEALASWLFREAWPVKWSMSEFRSQEDALAIDTLEFAYSAFQRG